MSKKKIIVKLVLLFITFFFPVCFSDWSYLTKNATISASNDNECVVRAHTRKLKRDVIAEHSNEKTILSSRQDSENTYSPKKKNTITIESHLVKTEKGSFVDGIHIPSFFDLLLFDGYSLTLKAKMILFPGSSFVTQKQSDLIFDPGEEVKYEDVKIDVNIPLIINVKVYIKGETTRNRGSLMAYDRAFISYNSSTHCSNNSGLNNLTKYWKVTRPSNHMILGNVVFRDISNYQYLVSGPISFSKKGMENIKESSFVRTYDIKGQQNGSLWFNSTYTTYESSFNLISSFNVLPLISNGRAYVKDSSLDREGTFDCETRLIHIGNQSYMLYTPNDFLVGGSNPDNQNALVDSTVKLKSVLSTFSNGIVKIEEGYFVNYDGIFVPVLDSLSSGNTYSLLNANIRKFCSNNDTGLYSNSTKYDSACLKYDSTAKMWRFYKFN